ncbi:MAG TPA: phosphoribosylanthranilate isomerase [Sphingomonas sp.]|jgi:phosphoribosylanthranilate isomerase|nr:phosphoribosylanthranilate isomerase [Sphingomonas sp.]
MIQAKICGLSTPETIDAAARHGASHVGFVFYPKSPRNVTPDQAAGLASLLPPDVARVGVMVDPDDLLVEQALLAVPMIALQLHNVTPARAAQIRRRVSVWVAIGVRNATDVALARTFKGAADRILYDAKTPEGTLPGGMGMRFDWTLLSGIAHPLPWTLSGGLDAHNLTEAARATGARMVDVSSGVESAPGAKDVDKIAAFLQAAARC